MSSFLKVLFTLTLFCPQYLSAQIWNSLGPEDGNNILCSHFDQDNNIFYIGNYEGFWYRDMELEEWTSRLDIGWIGREVHSIISHPNELGVIITGRKNGFFKGYLEYTDNWGFSNDYAYESVGGQIADLDYEIDNPNIIYAGSYADGPAGGEFIKSTDGGQNWSGNTTSHQAITSIFSSPVLNEVFTTGDALIQKSADGGFTWTSLSNGLSSSIILDMDGQKGNPSFLVCCDAMGIYRSFDGGENWEICYNIGCKKVKYNPAYENTIVVLTNTTKKVLISLDNGDNWTDITDDLPFGETLRDIEFSEDGHQLYCTTISRVYSRSINMVGEIEINTETISRNISAFPNPFNQSVKISFHSSLNAPVELNIYSVNGLLIKQIKENQILPHRIDIQWDGQDENNNFVAAGVYFCELKSGSKLMDRIRIIKF